MKKMIFGVCAGAVLIGVLGCVNTVNDRTTAGMPFVKDTTAAQYERPVDECFSAAKAVVSNMGTLVNEETLYNQTNSTGTTKTVQGKVNQRTVWIRVEPASPTMTAVTVQARTSGGGADIDLAHEIDKRIALKLVK
jgi:hypothetical protein